MSERRYVYDYCKKCAQATPHKIILIQTMGRAQGYQHQRLNTEVKARCNWCGNKIEVEWEQE